MISGHGNIETAVAAIKHGAYDFIEKPFKADRLVLVADRALETSRLKREVKQLKQLAPLPSTLVGKSAVMSVLRQAIERVAPTNSRVLIVGPSGAGKEVAARTLHQLSARTAGPFIVINAAAITPDRMETELFGIEANGADGRKMGALEDAHGGTLFIDDVADLPRETQNKILRVLVDQTFQRVGGGSKVAVDVRIVASTSRNLEVAIAEGTFREDLYHRLSVVPIRVPPLSERRDDIPEPDRLFHGSDFAVDRPAEAPHRRRRHGGAAVAWLARQCAPVAQQHRTPDDSGRRRSATPCSTPPCCRPMSARWCRAMPNGSGGEQLMGLPLRDGARSVRARISGGADFPLRRQHLAHRRIRRHGTLGAASRSSRRWGCQRHGLGEAQSLAGRTSAAMRARCGGESRPLLPPMIPQTS